MHQGMLIQRQAACRFPFVGQAAMASPARGERFEIATYYIEMLCVIGLVVHKPWLALMDIARV
jgi:hypothetical protein